MSRLRLASAALLLLAAPSALRAQDSVAASRAAAPEVQQLLDSAIVLARTYALFRDTVHWEQVIPELQRRLAGARTPEEAYPVLGMLTRSLGDRHSHVRVPPPMPARSGATGTESSAPGSAGRSAEPPIIPHLFRAERVGYLRVPAHNGADVDVSRDMAVKAREALAAQRAAGACGFVVDVRGNTGGNMWPMLAALRPLLGEAPLGAFRSPEENQRWGARAPWDAQDRYASGTPAWPDLSASPVAVLTNEYTASSGEAVVTAFRGRPNTQSFGTPTAGLSTVNNGYPLPGGVMLLLTTAVLADRNGMEYGSAIVPDFMVTESPDRDAPLGAALAWLSVQRDCATPMAASAAGR